MTANLESFSWFSGLKEKQMDLFSCRSVTNVSVNILFGRVKQAQQQLMTNQKVSQTLTDKACFERNEFGSAELRHSHDGIKRAATSGLAHIFIGLFWSMMSAGRNVGSSDLFGQHAVSLFPWDLSQTQLRETTGWNLLSELQQEMPSLSLQQPKITLVIFNPKQGSLSMTRMNASTNRLWLHLNQSFCPGSLHHILSAWTHTVTMIMSLAWQKTCSVKRCFHRPVRMCKCLPTWVVLPSAFPCACKEQVGSKSWLRCSFQKGCFFVAPKTQACSCNHHGRPVCCPLKRQSQVCKLFKSLSSKTEHPVKIVDCVDSSRDCRLQHQWIHCLGQSERAWEMVCLPLVVCPAGALLLATTVWRWQKSKGRQRSPWVFELFHFQLSDLRIVWCSVQNDITLVKDWSKTKGTMGLAKHLFRFLDNSCRTADFLMTTWNVTSAQPARAAWSPNLGISSSLVCLWTQRVWVSKSEPAKWALCPNLPTFFFGNSRHRQELVSLVARSVCVCVTNLVLVIECIPKIWHGGKTWHCHSDRELLNTSAGVFISKEMIALNLKKVKESLVVGWCLHSWNSICCCFASKAAGQVSQCLMMLAGLWRSNHMQSLLDDNFPLFDFKFESPRAFCCFTAWLALGSNAVGSCFESLLSSEECSAECNATAESVAATEQQRMCCCVAQWTASRLTNVNSNWILATQVFSSSLVLLEDGQKNWSLGLTAIAAMQTFL